VSKIKKQWQRGGGGVVGQKGNRQGTVLLISYYYKNKIHVGIGGVDEQKFNGQWTYLMIS